MVPVLLFVALVAALADATRDQQAQVAPAADEEHIATLGADSSSLLQKPLELVGKQSAERPHVIGLRRESVPIYRRGKIASFKTSYSGVLRVGSPAQDFRVVFDTGSGNLVLPAAECKSEACQVAHRRKYSQKDSLSSVPINADGSLVHEGELGEQVTIGFGTGEITGEFARDTVCFGSAFTADEEAALAQQEEEAHTAALIKKEAMHEEQNTHETESALVKSDDLDSKVDYSPMCVEMSLIVAVEMSTQPFKTFQFDGILGLSLDGLTMNKNFSTFDMLVRSGMAAKPLFSVFLTDGEFGEQSEVAMGGVDPRRLIEPIVWSDVAMHDMGYWQVRIKTVRIDGEELDICLDGTCRGVVDTGTSHLGVPAPWDKEFEKRLKRDAGDILDCRNVEAPLIEIELTEGKIITLHAFNYMRRLPLRDGVTVGSAKGVHVEDDKKGNGTAAESTPAPPPNTDPIILMQEDERKPGQDAKVEAKPQAPAPQIDGAGNQTAEGVKRHCSPRLMAVKLPEPLGPKLFILGEPVLHRYYTVYDWENKKVGFSLANNRRNTMDPKELIGQKGVLPKEVDMLLMQKNMKVARPKARPELEEQTVFMQVKVSLKVRRL